MTLLLLAMLAQPDPMESALWYAKRTEAKVDALNEKLELLIQQSIEARGDAKRLRERIDDQDKKIARIEAVIDALRSWKDTLEGKVIAFTAILVPSSGAAVSFFNRRRAIRDKKMGRG